MSRRGARRNAFYLLFQMDFSEAEEFEQVKELFFAESVYNITIVREGNRKPSFFPCLKRGKHEMRLKRGVTHP